MGIKAICAAAAVVVAGLGAAEAATIKSGAYSIAIELVDTYWFMEMPLETPPDPSPYLGLNLGDIVTGYIEFTVSDQVLNFFLKWPGAIIDRTMGVFYETDTNAYWATSFDESIEFALIDGHFTGRFSDGTTNDGWSQYAGITFHEIASVPLPATAALLPIGIGALALMRKRRRPA